MYPYNKSVAILAQEQAGPMPSNREKRQCLMFLRKFVRCCKEAPKGLTGTYYENHTMRVTRRLYQCCNDMEQAQVRSGSIPERLTEGMVKEMWGNPDVEAAPAGPGPDTGAAGSRRERAAKYRTSIGADEYLKEKRAELKQAAVEARSKGHKMDTERLIKHEGWREW